MHAGAFQRYVWVKGERKRQRNRDKYEETKRRYLGTEIDDSEPPKKPKVVWPGEFENQLNKRNRNLEKIDERINGSETPAIHTPSDTSSITSKNSHSNSNSDSESEPTSEDKVEEKPKKSSPRKPTKPTTLTPVSISDTHFLDEYLDPPKKLNPTSSGGSFFLVSSNLVNE
ncbi:hypothetical protein GCK72_024001 [Caenorhabditis remanei]|uniref:Uncharacterized protein n=1 Tax=Caenorhabditis remanei TaxID=31234 RepID=A0A6A5FY45_CAERE|nr:hypothetical protein GCK72_024001 [Caenorhabditis remanei]KAF1747536.1 hypothetical protein GCK72_024001 [Caenorhabditis remanei]